MKLIYLGSISISSGHRVDLLPDILMQVREQLPETKLHIYGAGDDVEKLKKMFVVRNLETAVHWHGRFSSPLEGEVSRILRDGGVVVDPVDASISNRAKSSFRCMLAGKFGCPVVTSNIGIRPYLFPQEFHDRFFARAESAADYAEKVVTCIKNPLTIEEKMRLQKHNEQFSWLQLATKYAKLLGDE